jgi:hypothetical protein
MGKDDNNGKDDVSKDYGNNGKNKARMVRMIGKDEDNVKGNNSKDDSNDNKDDKQGQQRQQGQ